MEQRGRWVLLTLGAAIVAYGVVILAFVATSPDLRLRCLLTDRQAAPGEVQGVEIQTTEGLQYKGPARPQAGDILLRIGERRTQTFIDVTQQVAALQHATVPAGWIVDPGFDPSRAEYFDLPWIFAENETGHRWVEVEFRPRDSQEAQRSWVLVQSVPLGQILLTFVWLVFQLAILAIGALAFWYRPFDRSARLFFAMSIVMLGAFIGGYHWWLVAGSFWLTVPFAACALIMPAVTLHFFLVYPRPLRPMLRAPRLTLTLVYGIPVVAIAGILGTLAYIRWLHSPGEPEANLPALEQLLSILRHAIYAHVVISGVYFLATLGALTSSFLAARTPIEHDQVKWILRAALLSTIPVGMALYQAHFDRVEFAFGGARLPMFAASLLFMAAYAISIVQHKLMLVDQIVSRGVLYYIVSGGLTLAVCLTIALGSVFDQILGFRLTSQQGLAVVAILMLGAVLLLWFRDFVQQAIDRRFFREKYQLDRALQRMNQAIGRLVDPSGLAEMMLGSCRDVLRVERAALYLRTSSRAPFQMVAAENADGMPAQFTPDEPFVDALRQDGSLQRVTPGTRSGMSPVQNQLRELRADLVHALAVDRGVEGLVVLGEKRNGTSFTAEDLTFLHALGQITHVALQSARIHQDITRLNEELRDKSGKITDQKRQIAMLQSELMRNAAPESSAAADPSEFTRTAIVGNSPTLVRVLETVRKVASSESSVLIRGESGTGKELLAQVLHENSPRRGGPVVAVHCASLAPSLLESELFGHVKGAFTGAHQDRVGRFESANGGTLFLDEIGDISHETQVKLLRVLQERCFEPVGGARTVHVDVRLITATHQNLEKLIADGRFREDLYYRLNVISIVLPPLRERMEDIFELALHFLHEAARRQGKSITHIDDEALTALERYGWPGNIRELQNVIERAVVLAEDNRITAHELPAEIMRGGAARPRQMIETKPPVIEIASTPIAGRLTSSGTTEAERPEREQLLDALRRCDGNKAQAARLLGLPRSTYFSKLKKYGIE